MADLRDEVRRTLAAATGPMGLADIAEALGLHAKEDKCALAKALHQSKTDGTITATPDPDSAKRRFLYTVATGTPSPAPRPRRQAAQSPLGAACAELEAAIIALVKDDGIVSVVRAYGDGED